MTRFVSAADANRRFSEILGQAAQGETVIITRRGRAVAQLTPVDRRSLNGAKSAAWERLLGTLAEGLPLGGYRIDRDSLYDW